MKVLKSLLNEQKAQLSVEYLIMIVFGIMLVVVAGIVIINLNTLLAVARSKILTYRDNILSNL